MVKGGVHDVQTWEYWSFQDHATRFKHKNIQTQQHKPEIQQYYLLFLWWKE